RRGETDSCRPGVAGAHTRGESPAAFAPGGVRCPGVLSGRAWTTPSIGEPTSGTWDPSPFFGIRQLRSGWIASHNDSACGGSIKPRPTPNLGGNFLALVRRSQQTGAPSPAAGHETANMHVSGGTLRYTCMSWRQPQTARIPLPAGERSL